MKRTPRGSRDRRPARDARSGPVPAAGRRVAAVLGLLAGTALAPAIGPFGLAAQEPESDEQAVLAVVQRLFDGMRANDGDIVRSVFADGAVLIGTEDREGEPSTRINPADGFADAVARATQSWDEPFWDPVVHVSDHLATVWTQYAFYLGGEQFLHCGVDAFILARSPDGGWKIVALADSRQTDNCELPPERRPDG